jgi:hypothetical protein
MRTRAARWGLSTAVLVVAGLALTACGPDDTSSAANSTTTASTSASTGGSTSGSSSSSSGSSAGSDSTSGSNAATSAPSSSGSSSGSDSTSGSNAATSAPSSGQDVDSVIPKGTPNKPGVRCTDQISYGKDSRNNADINSIGSATGYCPPVTMTGTLTYSGGQLKVEAHYATASSFDVTDETNIYGESLICSNHGDAGMPDKDGYGTIPCTDNQLVAAAKKGNVTVRVILDPASSSTAVLVQEKFQS